MAIKEKKRSFFARFRNYFIAGVVVLIPIGITIYLTIFLMSKLPEPTSAKKLS